LRIKAEEMLTLGLIDQSRFGGVDGVAEQILRIRDDVVPRWLDENADEIAASSATLVGFTCMFDQTIASLALAKLVKERAPEKLIAFGGYALRPPTGEAVMNAFPWVDAICTGEGEEVIGPLAEASSGLRPLADVNGLLVRMNGAVCATPPAPLYAMDRSPTPNFDDFFSDLAELERVHEVSVEVDTLPLETSRGCWWGAVKHCLFCGIADEDMKFRSRSADNVLRALGELRRRHRISSFRFSDYILPHEYYGTLLPRLARRSKKFRLACEMKANSSMKRFQLLAAAGFAEVQPGIESFSSDVLRKMDKGVTAIGNVQTLLLGKRFGVHIHYNFLYGFPDDDVREYHRIAAVLPSLFHLDPPLSRTEVQITRYAPLQATPQRFGIPKASYEPSYEVIFSRRFLERSGFDLDHYCYYFERPFENSPELTAVYRRITRVIDEWKKLHVEREVELWFENKENGMTVFDSRTSASGVTKELGEAEALVYASCVSEPTPVRALVANLRDELDEVAIAAALDALEEHRLLFRDGGSVIGLALPRVLAERVERVAASRAWAVV
jgi:ribosomal peptide maturation radical SAM protein 1